MRPPLIRITRQGGWVRWCRGGRGLSWTCTPPLFSERHGFRRATIRIGRWRIFYLSPIKDSP